MVETTTTTAGRFP
jgi:hypothetical protein